MRRAGTLLLSVHPAASVVRLALPIRMRAGKGTGVPLKSPQIYQSRGNESDQGRDIHTPERKTLFTIILQQFS